MVKKAIPNAVSHLHFLKSGMESLSQSSGAFKFEIFSLGPCFSILLLVSSKFAGCLFPCHARRLKNPMSVLENPGQDQRMDH